MSKVKYNTLSIRAFFTTVARIDMRSARFVFWDLGGQEDLQSLWDKVHTHAGHSF